jgi:hypothetical protein
MMTMARAIPSVLRPGLSVARRKLCGNPVGTLKHSD